MSTEFEQQVKHDCKHDEVYRSCPNLGGSFPPLNWAVVSIMRSLKEPNWSARFNLQKKLLIVNREMFYRNKA